MTFTAPQADRICVGDVVTVSWAPPAGVGDLTGYVVASTLLTVNPPRSTRWSFPADQTSFSHTPPFGTSSFQVHPVTAAGEAPSPIATGILSVSRPPQPVTWQGVGAAVGDGWATVPYRWGDRPRCSPSAVSPFPFG